MLDPVRLIQLQLQLECIGLDRNGRLTRIDGPDPDDIARAYFYRASDGSDRVYFREDVSDATAQRVLTMPLADAFLDGKRAADLAGGSRSERFSSYSFPAAVSKIDGVVAVLGDLKTRAELKRGGKVVAFCESARENNSAAEAWAFVDVEFRRQGLAKQVVQAWAQRVTASGKTPFYSHKSENVASARLAASLGLIRFSDVMTILD